MREREREGGTETDRQRKEGRGREGEGMREEGRESVFLCKVVILVFGYAQTLALLLREVGDGTMTSFYCISIFEAGSHVVKADLEFLP